MQYEEIVYVEPGSEQVVEMATTESIPTASDPTATYEEMEPDQALSPDHQQVKYIFAIMYWAGFTVKFQL